MNWFVEGAVAGALFAPANDPYTGTISLSAVGAAGLFVPISERIRLGGRVGYQWMPGSMQYDESTVLSIDDDPVPAVIRHEQEIALGTAFLEPMLLVGVSSWHFDLGVRIGAILNGEFESTQRIVDPPGVAFEDGPVRVDSSGPYPGLASIGAWATLGIGVNGTRFGAFRVDPVVSVSAPLTSMSTTAPFRVWSAAFSLRLVYEPRPALPLRIDTMVVTDTVIVESTTESGIREDLVVIGVDSTMSATATEQIKTIRIERELRRTVGIGMPLILTEAQALFLRSDGSTSESVTLRVTADRHELRVLDPHGAAATLTTLSKEPIDSVIEDVVDAAFIGVQRLPSTSVVRWTVEQWDTCRVRFHLSAGGDAEPTAWKLIVRDAQNRIIDSLGGAGQPPDMIERVIAPDVLRTLRRGGALEYAFAVSIDATRWTEPVKGTLTFEAMRERPGTTYTWHLTLPREPLAHNAGVNATWSEEQRRAIIARRSAWSPVVLESRLTPASHR